MTQSMFLIFIFALLISSGWALALPALNGLIVDLTYKHKKGEMIGIWDFFMDSGYFAGPLLGGIIAQIFGIRYIFLVIGIAFLVSTLLLLLMRDKQISPMLLENQK